MVSSQECKKILSIEYLGRKKEEEEEEEAPRQLEISKHILYQKKKIIK